MRVSFSGAIHCDMASSFPVGLFANDTGSRGVDENFLLGRHSNTERSCDCIWDDLRLGRADVERW